MDWNDVRSKYSNKDWRSRSIHSPLVQPSSYYMQQRNSAAWNKFSSGPSHNPSEPSLFNPQSVISPMIQFDGSWTTCSTSNPYGVQAGSGNYPNPGYPPLNYASNPRDSFNASGGRGDYDRNDLKSCALCKGTPIAWKKYQYGKEQGSHARDHGFERRISYWSALDLCFRNESVRHDSWSQRFVETYSRERSGSRERYQESGKRCDSPIRRRRSPSYRSRPHSRSSSRERDVSRREGKIKQTAAQLQAKNQRSSKSTPNQVNNDMTRKSMDKESKDLAGKLDRAILKSVNDPLIPEKSVEKKSASARKSEAFGKTEKQKAATCSSINKCSELAPNDPTPSLCRKETMTEVKESLENSNPSNSTPNGHDHSPIHSEAPTENENEQKHFKSASIEKISRGKSKEKKDYSKPAPETGHEFQVIETNIDQEKISCTSAGDPFPNPSTVQDGIASSKLAETKRAISIGHDSKTNPLKSEDEQSHRVSSSNGPLKRVKTELPTNEVIEERTQKCGVCHMYILAENFPEAEADIVEDSARILNVCSSCKPAFTTSHHSSPRGGNREAFLLTPEREPNCFPSARQFISHLPDKEDRKMDIFEPMTVSSSTGKRSSESSKIPRGRPRKQRKIDSTKSSEDSSDCSKSLLFGNTSTIEGPYPYAIQTLYDSSQTQPILKCRECEKEIGMTGLKMKRAKIKIESHLAQHLETNLYHCEICGTGTKSIVDHRKVKDHEKDSPYLDLTPTLGPKLLEMLIRCFPHMLYNSNSKSSHLIQSQKLDDSETAVKKTSHNRHSSEDKGKGTKHGFKKEKHVEESFPSEETPTWTEFTRDLQRYAEPVILKESPERSEEESPKNSAPELKPELPSRTKVKLISPPVSSNFKQERALTKKKRGIKREAIQIIPLSGKSKAKRDEQSIQELQAKNFTSLSSIGGKKADGNPFRESGSIGEEEEKDSSQLKSSGYFSCSPSKSGSLDTSHLSPFQEVSKFSSSQVISVDRSLEESASADQRKSDHEVPVFTLPFEEKPAAVFDEKPMVRLKEETGTIDLKVEARNPSVEECFTIDYSWPETLSTKRRGPSFSAAKMSRISSALSDWELSKLEVSTFSTNTALPTSSQDLFDPAVIEQKLRSLKIRGNIKIARPILKPRVGEDVQKEDFTKRILLSVDCGS